MTIKLSSELDQFVKELVVAGTYPSKDDAVAEGLRLLMSREQLKAEIAKAAKQLDDGLGLEEDEVFDEIEAAISTIEKQQAGR